MTPTMSRAAQAETLLQEGVSSAQAILFAINASEMLGALPTEPHAVNSHNHARQLLGMLEDNLRVIQAQVDALSNGEG
ncbi:hypothetical protein ACFOKI_15815 [Sphingomonas qilianensis]|uniref:hypothetical protein n=1 Tax=Sphingomonas qilianensis TaxID=1736690 RepID=UPI003610B37E